MDAGRQTFPLIGLRRGVGAFGRTRRSTHRGSGYEMASSRPYQRGDNMRSIDWRASARLSSAHDSDEFIVREHFAEESPRAVLFVDRRPAMGLYPPELPWLRKPAAVAVAGRMIVDSVLAAQGLLGYLDLADPFEPQWLPPRRRLDAPVIREHELNRHEWTAPEDNLTRGCRHLVRLGSDVPRGTFIFVLSDFIETPLAPVWRMAQARGLDVVPVIVQDPRWEQSFPAVGGIVLPLATPDGRLLPVRLTHAEAAERRAANEARLRTLLDGFAAIEIDAVVLSSDDPLDVLAAFVRWHDQRHLRLRLR